MNFEKSIRALISPAYDPTDPIAATDEEAVDLAELNTDVRPGRIVWSVIEETDWPNSLSLRICLVPVAFSDHHRAITATFASNETVFASTMLYDASHQEGKLLDHCYAGIDLMYEGTGSLVQEETPQFFSGWQVGEYQIKPLQAKPGLLYHKAFPTQTAASLMCTQQHQGSGQWLTSTHLQKNLRVNEIPIFSYGGVYQKDLSIDLVMPLYATLAGTSDYKTRVTLKSQKFWHDKGVYENRSVQVDDTVYTFHDPISGEEELSLGAAILKGAVRILLEREGEHKIYRSRCYQNIRDQHETLEITFIATE